MEIINPNLFLETLEEERKSKHKSLTSKVNPMSISSAKFTEIERLESYRMEEEEKEERNETGEELFHQAPKNRYKKVRLKYESSQAK